MTMYLKHDNIDFKVGDTVDVHYKLIEKETVAGKAKREKHEEVRERTQIFSGLVISTKGSGENKTFTVRHMGAGAIGVERIFPLISPWIKKIVIKKRTKVRRAKLYYIREKTRKETERMKESEFPQVKDTLKSKAETANVKSTLHDSTS